MKIEIYTNIPSKYEGIEELKKLLGKGKVKAYSIDLRDNSIVEGNGYIDNDNMYNYHTI